MSTNLVRLFRLLGPLWLSLLLSSCAAYGKHRVIDEQPTPPFQISERQPDTPYLDFLALGDTGTGGEGQKLVAEALADQARQQAAAFVLLLGDNFYELGLRSAQDSEWQSKFEDIYFHDSLQIPFHAVLGNHDHYGNPNAQLDYTRLTQTAQQGSGRWSMPARYYHFTQPLGPEHSVLFVALDTEPLANPFQTQSEQLAWLEKTLQDSDATWKIVFGHHPLYSGGQHGHQPHLISQLEPLFVKYGVDLYLAGHDHDQQLLQPRQGVHYVVSGAGAKSRDVRWLPETLYAATNFGFTRYRIAPDELVISFFTGQGQLAFAYTIPK